jgi:hypothetical protein
MAIRPWIYLGPRARVTTRNDSAGVSSRDARPSPELGGVGFAVAVDLVLGRAFLAAKAWI